MAQEELHRALNNHRNMNKAKNVILFIGDGMSLGTVTASRIYKGQQNGYSGEEGLLEFEKFPNVGLAKVVKYLWVLISIYCAKGRFIRMALFHSSRFPYKIIFAVSPL